MVWLAIAAGALVVVVTTLVLFSVMAAGMADRSVRRPAPPPRPMDRPSFAPAAAAAEPPYAVCGTCRNVYESADPDPLPPCPSCGGALTRTRSGAVIAAQTADSGRDTWY
ncbi:MAG TPA: hypothetical protein VFR97_08765 [Capillimicrobium sp.]|nr:hypothetical protein [Capillimicrobium sp.]